MNGIHKLLGIAVALGWVAFGCMVGLPAMAAQPQKSYNLEFLLPDFDSLGNHNPVYDADLQLVAPTTVTVRLKNESPPSVANSNISSFQFALTGLNLAVNGASCAANCTAVGNTVYVTNISPPIQAQQTFDVTLLVTSCVVVNDANVGSITAYTGSQLNGDTFVPLAKNDSAFPMVLTLSKRIEATQTTPLTITATGISCGTIGCNGSFAVENFTCSSASVTDCVSTIRGNNKDGVCSTSVDYFVTNLLRSGTNPLLHFNWATDPAAAFAYQLTVKPQPPADPGWQLSWLPVSGAPVFISAPLCIGADLGQYPPSTIPFPKSYGALTASVKTSDKFIYVDTSTGQVAVPSPFPSNGFPIVVGTERMQVTKINTNKWTVSRAQGGTSPTTPGIGAPVMNTPLPLLADAQFSTDTGTRNAQLAAGYFVGQQAQMCRAALSHDNQDGTWSTWVMDIGDGWVLGR
jgi:hypothetical protein